MKALGLATVWCLLAGIAQACAPEDTALLVSEGDAPPAFVRFDPPPMSQPFLIELWVCDGADLRVDATMPTHQHGMNYDPVIQGDGTGRYQVDGMVFHMPGVWQISVVTDRATYTFDVTLP